MQTNERLHPPQLDVELQQIHLDLHISGVAAIGTGVLAALGVYYLMRMYPPCGSYAYLLGAAMGSMTAIFGRADLFRLQNWFPSMSREFSDMDKRFAHVLRSMQSPPLLCAAALAVGAFGFAAGDGLFTSWDDAIPACTRFGSFYTIIFPALLSAICVTMLLGGMNMLYVRWRLTNHPVSVD